MPKSLTNISQVGEHLIAKFEQLEFVSAYAKGKRFTVFQNKISDDIDLNALEFFCLNSLFENNKIFDNNDQVIIDYGNNGLITFYKIDDSSTLILAADKQLFPLVNQEIKKIKMKALAVDLEEIKEPLVKHAMPKEEDKSIPKELQQKGLPDLSILKPHFNKHFSYYSQKNKLSNDFYWLKETTEHIYIVVVDCNGYDNIKCALSKVTLNTILEKNPKDLKTSLELFYEELDQPKEGGSMSFEMAICRFDKKSGAIDITTSGVPALYIENEKDYNLVNVKTRQGSSKSSLKTESIKLYTNKGDKLIFYSDGLANQLHSDEVKKLDNRGVREMFISMNGSFSKEAFESSFSKWKGNSKQNDDIILLALEI